MAAEELNSKLYLLPASYAQERMWILDRLEPESTTYNIPFALVLKGKLNVELLHDSLQEMVQRHEVLRTAFSLQQGKPMQVVAEFMDIPLPVVKVTGETVEEREKWAFQSMKKEANKPFDLTQAPLFSAKLYVLGKERHVLFINVHHIIFDGWSVDILIRDLTRLYEDRVAGQVSTLAELPVQYADYAHWQKEWLEEGETESQLAYWKEQLAGELPRLQLPTDRPRPAKQSFHGAMESFALSPKVTKGLRDLSRREGTTLFMTLLAGFQVLMYRYSGQTDLLVGTPVANRNDRDLEDVMGLFVNTLVLRTDLSESPTFRQLLHRVRKVCLSAYAHQELPFEKLVEYLQPERDMSHNPLFQVMFSFQEGEQNSIPVGSDLLLEVVKIDNDTAKFDLGLFMTEQNGTLTGGFEYNTDLYDAQTIRQMARHLSALLESAAFQPDTSISHLSYLTESERIWLMEEVNRTTSEYPDLCFHHLFEDQVSRTPDAVAVSFGDREMTYRELDQCAEGLAAYLRNKGVGREDLVGIHLKQSPDRLVGMLGIWKAGGAYLPLDPAYPVDRLKYMVQDSGLRWILTIDTELWGDYPAVELVQMDRDWMSETENEQGPRNRKGDLNRLAYVIYTSGSTGLPKGVAVEQRALVNHMTWFQREYPLNENDRVLQMTAFGFDASLLEWCAPLVAGARLVLPEGSSPLHPDALVTTIREKKITRVQLVASLWRLLLNHPHIGECNSLRQAICGGESLTPSLQERFFSLLDAELIHLYGPTETCIDATHWRCFPEEDVTCIPIGRPIANAEVYVLDEHRQLVPPGVAGELYIGGAGLARGYLNRPDLTAQAFVSHPFSDDTKARLYKSGDRVCYRRDGSLEFLGRMDRQVKVRGFRIEPGEVEQILMGHASVKEAVVRVHDGSLIAYIVPEKSGELPAERLKAYLQDFLPPYMVPTHLLQVDTMPLTPNGKLDHRSLPLPDTVHRQEEEKMARDRLELEMVQIWKELLDVPSVGVQDNFFDIGGHSLKGIELVEMIRQQFSVDLSLSVLFRKQTVTELCDYIRNTGSSFTTNLIRIQEGTENSSPLILFHPGGGGAMCYVHLAKALGQEKRVYGFQATGYESDVPPFSSISEMADCYYRELHENIPKGPYRLAGWSLGGTLAVEVARRLEAAGELVEFIGLLDAHAFDYRQEDTPERKEPLDAWAESLGMREEERVVAEETTKMEWILIRLQEAGMLPEGVGLETVRRYLKVMNANRKASESYRFSTPIASDLYLFQAEDLSTVNPLPKVDPGKWRERTQGRVHVIPVKGNHHVLMESPYVEQLAEKIKDTFATINCLTDTDTREKDRQRIFQ